METLPSGAANPPPPMIRRADLWTGLFAVAFGIAIVWIGADYPIGQGGRAGPGYVPRLLGGLLIGVGLALAARALWTGDAVETTFRPRPVLLVLASVLTFAVVFDKAGLVPAIIAAVAIANWASPDNGWLSAIGLGAVLAVFSWALFIVALKLPMPVFRF